MDRRPNTTTTIAIVAAFVVVLISGCATASPTAPPASNGPTDPGVPTPPNPEEGDVPAFEETTPVTGHLTLGPPGEVTSMTIGSAGGTMEASGLRIEFAPDTLAAETSFSVSAAPITAADFGGTVTPLTSLYTVESGGVTLLSPVTVTLAATIPDGATAMAFWYDDAAGMITPLTPVAQDGASLTVGATHFSSIFGALIDLAKLPTTVDSGFRPGQDDWQFTNEGSYVAPGGHCEGQTVSAIWYYVNQRRQGGASPLYGLYDNNRATEKTPTYQWDDSDGYRLASTVQNDPVAVPFTYRFLLSTQWDRADGRLTHLAFWAAIAFSAEPQLIGINTAAGDAGHAMIVYRVTPERLFIADPNYPATLRTIRYDATTGKLDSYGSGPSAADIDANGVTVYTRFAYLPWRASKSEAALAGHWAEFEAGTIGDGVFPDYVLEANAVDADGFDTWVPLVDGYQSPDPELTIHLIDPLLGKDVAMEIFPGTSSTALEPLLQAEWTIELADGVNELGIRVDFGLPGGERGYVDFVRVSISYDASPTPTPPTREWRWVDASIEADVQTSEGPSTCSATLYLRFRLLTSGSPWPSPEPGASIRAVCKPTTSTGEWQPFEASGTFDGRNFVMDYGKWHWTGTFDGATATITGGPGNATYVFNIAP